MQFASVDSTLSYHTIRFLCPVFCLLLKWKHVSGAISISLNISVENCRYSLLTYYYWYSLYISITAWYIITVTSQLLRWQLNIASCWKCATWVWLRSVTDIFTVYSESRAVDALYRAVLYTIGKLIEIRIFTLVGGFNSK